MSVPVIHPVFSNVDTLPIMAVGTVVEDPANAKAYKYVKFLDAVTYAAGQSVEYANVACTSVTNDRSGGSSLEIVAGILPDECRALFSEWVSSPFYRPY